MGRYSRDILARSKVGGIVIDKQAVGSVLAPDAGGVSHYNRTFAADTTLAVHRNLTMTGFVAKTQTPGLTSGDMASYARATWLSPAFHVYTEFADLQENFNPEVGFVPRLGIRTSKFHGEWNPRPGRFNIRMFDPMWNITYTTDQHNRLLTRRIHNMIGTYFEDGSSVMFYFNDHFEQLDIPFPIRNTGVTVPAGTYRFGEWVFSYQSDPSRRLYTRTRYSPQTFFDGTRTDIQATVGLRATSRVSAETIFNRSDVDLPWGHFVADLASLRLDLTLSPTVTLRSLSQYNSLTGELSNSIRFNWIYSPGSDIYIAYDEMRLDDLFYLNPHVRRSPWGDVRNRQIADQDDLPAVAVTMPAVSDALRGHNWHATEWTQDQQVPIARDNDGCISVHGQFQNTIVFRIPTDVDLLRGVNQLRFPYDGLKESISFITDDVSVELVPTEYVCQFSDEVTGDEKRPGPQCSSESLPRHRVTEQQGADQNVCIEDEPGHPSSRMSCSIAGVRPRRCAFRLISSMTSRSDRSVRVASRNRRLTSRSSLRRSMVDAARYAAATSESTDTVMVSAMSLSRMSILPGAPYVRAVTSSARVESSSSVQRLQADPEPALFPFAAGCSTIRRSAGARAAPRSTEPNAPRSSPACGWRTPSRPPSSTSAPTSTC